jgi:hypothetical protein
VRFIADSPNSLPAAKPETDFVVESITFDNAVALIVTPAPPKAHKTCFQSTPKLAMPIREISPGSQKSSLTIKLIALGIFFVDLRPVVDLSVLKQHYGNN